MSEFSSDPLHLFCGLEKIIGGGGYTEAGVTGNGAQGLIAITYCK